MRFIIPTLIFIISFHSMAQESEQRQRKLQSISPYDQLKDSVFKACNGEANKPKPGDSAFRFIHPDIQAIFPKNRFPTCLKRIELEGCVNPSHVLKVPDLNQDEVVQTSIAKDLLDLARAECNELVGNIQQLSSTAREEFEYSSTCEYKSVSLGQVVSVIRIECEAPHDKVISFRQKRELEAREQEKERMALENKKFYENTRRKLEANLKVEVDKFNIAAVEHYTAESEWIACYNSWRSFSRIRLYKEKDLCMYPATRKSAYNGEEVTMRRNDLVNEIKHRLAQPITVPDLNTTLFKIKKSSTQLIQAAHSCREYTEECRQSSFLEWNSHFPLSKSQRERQKK